MHNWFWPQYFMAILYLLGVIANLFTLAKGKPTPTQALLGFLIKMIVTAAIVYILHAGGFW